MDNQIHLDFITGLAKATTVLRKPRNFIARRDRKIVSLSDKFELDKVEVEREILAKQLEESEKQSKISYPSLGELLGNYEEKQKNKEANNLNLEIQNREPNILKNPSNNAVNNKNYEVIEKKIEALDKKIEGLTSGKNSNKKQKIDCCNIL